MEKVYTFGKDGCLAGIVTEPSSGVQKEGTPAVLLLNAGLLHRVGPHRLSVDLARMLASMGFTTLRFDLSGIGDSDTRTGTQSYKKRAVDDIREAMDFLAKKKGIHHFVLEGLCSGADNAQRVAVKDKRVSGVVLLDACGYPTLGFYVRHIARRMFSMRMLNIRKWKKLTKRNFSCLVKEKNREEIFTREFPHKKDVKTDIVGMIVRGVNFLYIYSGGVQKYYNYHGQFEDMFRFKPTEFKGKLQLEYFNESDHLYTLTGDRTKLVKTICDWIQACYT